MIARGIYGLEEEEEGKEGTKKKCPKNREPACLEGTQEELTDILRQYTPSVAFWENGVQNWQITAGQVEGTEMSMK